MEREGPEYEANRPYAQAFDLISTRSGLGERRFSAALSRGSVCPISHDQVYRYRSNRVILPAWIADRSAHYVGLSFSEAIAKANGTPTLEGERALMMRAVHEELEELAPTMRRIREILRDGRGG